MTPAAGRRAGIKAAARAQAGASAVRQQAGAAAAARPRTGAAVAQPSAAVPPSAARAVSAAPSGVGPSGVGPTADPVTTDVFAEKLLAVLSGQRPVHWMLRHTVGHAYDDLARLAERFPLRARGTRPVVRDIGHCEPRPGALEVFARIAAGEQLRALAFRLEQGSDLRWRCTAVELGGPRPPRRRDD